MTSDVKLSNYFLLIKVKSRRVLNIQIIQKTISRQLRLVDVGKLLRFKLQTYFNLNVLKFELQHDWTPRQKYFCRYRVLQLLCHDVEGAHDIKCSKN